MASGIESLYESRARQQGWSANINTPEQERQSHRRRKKTAVAIPDSSRTVKDWFLTEPERAKVLEIVKYVSETGKAHLHPDVTYAPIVKGSRIKYLEVFSLVEKFKYDEDNWCVCAACPHDFPQFKNQGIVAWLEDDRTIKIIGWDCFKRHDPDAHRAAEAIYHQDKAKRSDEEYLLRRAHLIPLLATDVAHDAAIARAFDGVRAKFHAAIHVHKLTELYRHVQKGQLKLEVRKRQHTYGGGSKTVTTHPLYASIKGYAFLSTKGGNFGHKFAAVAAVLRELEARNLTPERVVSMSDAEKGKAAGDLGTALADLRSVRLELEDAREFIGPITGRTMQRWSREPNTTYAMLFEYDEVAMRIGMSPLDCTVVEIPVEARERLSGLPDIAPKRRN